MNTTHRSIWNASLGAWVAVSEITRACGKRGSTAVALVLIGSSVCSSVGAQDVSIDAGASVTVPVPQASPWNIGGTLLVGNTGTGTLTVSNGGTVSNVIGYLGFDAGSTGNATVTGANSTWTNSGPLTVGNLGQGTLTVSGGGAVSSSGGFVGRASGSTGNATVTGAGATWANSSTLSVGFSGTGTLTVSNGGTVSNTNGLIGWNQGSTGSATVTGAGSTWTNAGVLNVGRDGTGTLAVSDGGRVSNTDGAIGDVAGSIGNAMVTGANSIWANSGALYVGAQGTGTLTVQDGGTVSNTVGSLGLSSAAIGNATVTGANSTWANSGTLQVGRSGTGTLTVQDGGTASNTDGLLGLFSGASGHATVTGAGSTWTSSGGLYVGVSGAGTLTVANGGQVSVNSGVGVLHVAELSGSTGVLNIGAVVGNAAEAAGTVAAGELRFAAGTGSLNFNHTDAAYVFGTRITGAGMLNQVAGTTILTGANSYSGATTIGGGTLRAGAVNTLSVSSAVTLTNTAGATLDLNDFNQAIGSLAGGGATGGDVIVGSGTLTTGGNNTSTSFGAVISGSGGLTKQGSGTQTLTGSNTFSGSLTISAGTLALGTGGGLASTVAVNVNGAGARFDISAAGNQTIGSLSGVTGGSVALGANTLTLGDASNRTFSGTISGINGGLIKQGSGNLVLTGANTYSGGTTVTAGTLQGDTTSLQGNITNNAALNFDQAATGSYTGAISGTGTFTKLGAGNLILAGVNTYNGATTVNAGTLSVNGSIANSAVTINNGGTLGGSGTLGNTTIASGGILAPGNSIGTLTVNGNLSFAAGSIYRVEVDAAGANDRINATGTATINGGTVDVQTGAGTYAANTQYTILNAAGGRTGNFAGVTSNLAFLTPTLGYDANNVFLTLARNDISFSAVAITPNQIATSTALQNAVTGVSGDMSTVMNVMTGLSAAQARAAYDSASGAGLVALRNAGASFAAGFGSQLQARLAAVGGANTRVGAFAGGPILLAANDHVSDLMAPVSDSPQKFSLGAAASSSASPASSPGRGFWLRGAGGYQNTKSDSNAAASELRKSSISAGFDAELREGLVVGAALSSGTSRLGFDNTDTGKSRGSAVALYGSYVSGLWTFKGSASAAWHNNHMNRAVVVGAIQRTAAADFDSNTLSAHGEASYSLPMNGWTLQPLAGLSFSRNKADGFTETGAGALNLQVAGQTVNSAKSTLGAKASFDAGRIRIEPRVAWAHEFGDLNTPMTAQFQGAAAASPFLVSGAALKRDTLILGLGASGSIGKGMDLFADVQAEHNSAQRTLAVLVGLRSRW
ncbi:autotransporter domain-containing protein [Polaromonas sp. LjRoot131]|uniref:autotransporter domain-containing protein n=1 Tax=Polaromonas sp. LjRoot131 TaxID=3342262 RepID=UPI003ED072F9